MLSKSTFRISEKIDHELVTKMIELYIIWEKTKSFAHAQNVQM
jgi:hypothetical protein